MGDDGLRAEPEVLAGPGTVTTIAGFTFAISDEVGDIDGGPVGLMVQDTRHLSRLEVRLDGEPLHHLGAGLLTSEAAHFRGFGLAGDGYPDAPLEGERMRRVSAYGMDEEIVLHCWAPAPLRARVTLAVEADFADIFEVRRLTGGAAPPALASARRTPGEVRLSSETGRSTTVRLSPAADEVDDEGRLCWRPTLTRGEPWRLCIAVRAEGPGARTGGPPEVHGDDGPHPVTVRTQPEPLARACRRSLADFRRLSMRDELRPERLLLAAGIPWFVALFGRDSIISSYQARAFDPWRMGHTLEALAARQGRVSDPGNGEEPGKILHEVRLTDRPWLGHGTTGGARPYYGTVDATPLWLILYGAAWRWGLARETLTDLLPAARAAMGWLQGPGDLDGDGLIEYRAMGDRALTNQGWKDSENAVQFADGRLAEGSIALVEVQGYGYRARRELSAVLAWLGEDEEAADLAREADALRDLIRRAFWVDGGDGPGFFALALDGAKRPVDSVASNMGHLLWCGVPSNPEAEQVAAHLGGAAMASGWGLRTLSCEMGGYNPISYHVGSVWPHDTAIVCEGLRRYGMDEVAMRLTADLIDALAMFDERLPELFGGQTRGESDFPVPYPTACRPQAWAAGVPLTFVPLLLGLEPAVPAGFISMSPDLPPGLPSLEVRGIPFPGGVLSVSVDEDGLRVISSPRGLGVELRARPQEVAALR